MSIVVASERPYDVSVGTGIVTGLGALIRPDVARVAVICDAGLEQEALALGATIRGVGPKPHLMKVPSGEQAKSADVLIRLWSLLGQAGFTRSDLIVGVGGGATTDLAGFVAATWLRGIDFITIPTTVLGMVDAAVGGKTGIDTPEGKNLVGAFHEPLGVLCDLDFLRTLPQAELRSGFAEIIKCGFIADSSILDDIESDPRVVTDPDHGTLSSLIERGIQVKATTVATDLTERTTAVGDRIGREALNYGHTLGHAIELYESYTRRHGEGIAIGMVFVAELARVHGLIDSHLVDRHRNILGLAGLPTTYEADAWPALQQAMLRDKKTRGHELRFVVLDALASPRILAGPAQERVDEAYRRIST